MLKTVRGQAEVIAPVILGVILLTVAIVAAIFCTYKLVRRYNKAPDDTREKDYKRYQDAKMESENNNNVYNAHATRDGSAMSMSK